MIRKRTISFLAFSSVCIILILGCNKTVSVSPPDKPPPNGTVFINSNPKGAIIYLNGLPQRRITPDSITWLMTGVDTITLKKTYFRDTSFVVHPVEGEKHSYFIDYAKDPLMLGQINFTSLPTNSSILLNDSGTGLVTPFTLSNLLPGIYNITYKYKNHRDNSFSVIVQSNTLTPAYAILVDTTLWEDYNTSNSQIQTDNLSCIACDQTNKFWIGTQNNGLILYDGLQWTNYVANGSIGSPRLTNNHILTVKIDANNVKWVGTESGLTEYIGDGPDAIENDTGVVGAVYLEPNEVIYSVGPYIRILRPDVPKPTTLYPVTFNSQDYYITGITLDKGGNFWAGTRNAGIYYNTDTWHSITTSNSSVLLSDQITAITSDESGNILVGFPARSVLANGIASFNGSSWQTYYVLPNGATTNSLYVDSKNRVWIGTTKGLVEKDGSNVSTFNYDDTGLNIANVSGVITDKYGNIWITTYDAGLFEYKGAK